MIFKTSLQPIGMSIRVFESAGVWMLVLEMQVHAPWGRDLRHIDSCQYESKEVALMSAREIERAFKNVEIRVEGE